MGQTGTSVGISALMGGIQGFLASGNPVGFVVGLAIGAAVGGIAAIANQPKTPGPRRTLDELFSTSTRNAPVPVVFGRARMAGNHLSVGSFWIITSNLPNTPGRYIYIANCIVGLCEGPIQIAGDFFIDRDCRENLAKKEQQPLRNYAVQIINGTPTDTISTYVSRADAGYSETPMVPFRNTAKAVLFTIVGDTPRLPDLNLDLVGPDYTINMAKTTTDPNPSDSVSCTYYDSFTQCWYSVVTGSSLESSPFGMVMQGRGNHPRRYYTPPPASISGSIEKGWYLGRHDILVMQDPSNSMGFWIGCWGITSSSPLWEYFKPDAGYANPIILHQLDELHGILHTLHDDGTTRYVMQWNLLSGRVIRLNTTGLPVTGTWRAMLYSADQDTYIFASGDPGSTGPIKVIVEPKVVGIPGGGYGSTGGLYFVHPRTGEVTTSFNGIPTGHCTGLCVSGILIGVFSSDTGLYYYDPVGGGVLGPYGTTDTGTDVGSLGADAISQNTYTNHVTLAKNASGSAVYVNFFPSVIESVEDLSADGTPESKHHPEGEFQTFPADDVVAGWIRDWSYRTYNHMSLTLLQGNSCIAAAAWHTLFSSGNINKAVDAAKADDNLYTVGANNYKYDSARWGAGIDASLGNFSSFESVHGFCVGGSLQTRLRIVKGNSRTYYGERAKVDFVIDSFRNASDIVATELLALINGYRKIENGQLVIGYERKGQFPLWHFGDDQTEDGKSALQFTGRIDGINRVRVQWTHVRDDYRKDIVQADDEYNQNAVGRVHEQMINVTGIGRIGHARWLAQLVLDTITASRRQLTFNTHFLGYILSPGDTVEVTQVALGVNRMPAIVHELKEAGEKLLTVTVLEHPLLQAASTTSSRVGIPTTPTKGLGPGTGPGTGGYCGLIKGALSTNTSNTNWMNLGAAYAAGDYTVYYVGGSYRTNMMSVGESAQGYEVVTMSGGVITPIADIATASGTFSSQQSVELVNSGIYQVITLPSTGPIGIRLKDGYTAYASTGPSLVTFNVCQPIGSPGGGTSPTPTPTPTACDDCESLTLPSSVTITLSTGGCPAPFGLTQGDSLTFDTLNETSCGQYSGNVNIFLGGVATGEVGNANLSYIAGESCSWYLSVNIIGTTIFNGSLAGGNPVGTYTVDPTNNIGCSPTASVS